jgi:hypothetical protein
MSFAFRRTYTDIECEILDLREDLSKDILLTRCKVEHLILPVCCTRLSTVDSTVKKIKLNVDIENMYCYDSGIEELDADGPLHNVRYMLLSGNKIKKFNLHIIGCPSEINLSSNQITEIKHKIPFHWAIDTRGNPIYEEKAYGDYIDFTVN